MGQASAARGPYYRPAEVARLLRCSEWWIKEQARRRRIPFCWIGGSYLFTEEHIAAIVRLFEGQPVEAVTSARSGGPARRSEGSPGAAAVTLVALVPRRVRAARNDAA